MERNTNTDRIEPKGPTAPPAMGGTADLAGTASLEKGGRVRGRLVSGWRFTRHLLEMGVAMVAGMAALGVWCSRCWESRQATPTCSSATA